MEITTIVNEKGGIAKTTTSVSIAHLLATRFAKKVLLIDLDPQGNSSAMFLPDYKNVQPSLATFFNEKDFDIKKCIRPAMEEGKEIIQGLDIIHSNANLKGAVKAKGNIGLSDLRMLEDAIEGLDYDHLIFDCPPDSPELQVVNAIIASNDFIIPVAGGFASDAIEQVLNSIAKSKGYKKLINVFEQNRVRFVRCAVDARNKKENIILSEILEPVSDFVANTVVRASTDVKNAQNASPKQLITSINNHRITDDYIELIKELFKIEEIENVA